VQGEFWGPRKVGTAWPHLSCHQVPY